MKISKLIKVSSKIVFVLSIITVIFLVLLYQSVVDRNHVISKQLELKQLGGELLDASDYLTNEVRAYVQFGEKEHYDNYWKEVNETKTRDRVVRRLTELNTPQDLLDLVEEAKNNSDTLVNIEDQAMKAVQSNDFDKARDFVFGQEYDDGKKRITKPLNEFQEKLDNWAQSESDKALHKMIVLLWSTIVVIIINILSMTCVLFVLLKKVSPLNKVTEIANQVAKGDLNITYLDTDTNDEVAELSQAINQMVKNLKNLIESMVSTSFQVATFSEELMSSAEQASKATEIISIASQDVAAGTEHQVISTDVATKDVDEISKGMNQVATSIQSVSNAAKSTSEEAKRGNHVLQLTVEKMNVVHEKVESTSHVIKILEEKSKEIGQIVTLITEISNQTNLLALNAAIEAARAGENGLGFSIVADEVRKLAEQSGAAAEKIKSLILEIQTDTQNAVSSINVGTQAVQEGIEHVRQTGESFRAISSKIEEVSTESQDVSTIVKEVNDSSQGMVAIMESVAQISKQTSNNSQDMAASSEEQLASMEEITSAATSLAKMADDLQTLIKKFNV